MQGKVLTRTSPAIQRDSLTLSTRRRQHPYRPKSRFGPNQSQDFGSDFSDLSSLRGHYHRVSSCYLVCYESTFLCSLRSGPVTGFHRYYGHCGLLRGRLFGARARELRLVIPGGLPDSRIWPSRSFRLQTPDRPRSSL